MIKRLQVRFPSAPPPGNNSGPVVHTHVPLSANSIIWHWSKSDDAIWLGRWPQAWRKVMAAYRRVCDCHLPRDRDQLRTLCLLVWVWDYIYLLVLYDHWIWLLNCSLIFNLGFAYRPTLTEKYRHVHSGQRHFVSWLFMSPYVHLNGCQDYVLKSITRLFT